MSGRFVTKALIVLLGAFVVVASQSFGATTVGWIGFPFGAGRGHRRSRSTGPGSRRPRTRRGRISRRPGWTGHGLRFGRLGFGGCLDDLRVRPGLGGTQLRGPRPAPDGDLASPPWASPATGPATRGTRLATRGVWADGGLARLTIRSVDIPTGGGGGRSFGFSFDPVARGRSLGPGGLSANRCRIFRGCVRSVGPASASSVEMVEAATTAERSVRAVDSIRTHRHQL